MASGDEERNAAWTNSRRRYDVSYGIRRADDLAKVVAFFEARNARLHGFRFKDWSDYRSCPPSQIPVATDQVIGTKGRHHDGVRSGEAISIRRTILDAEHHKAGRRQRDRRAERRAAIDRLERRSGERLVSFAAAPGDGIAITAGFEFDVPVRFSSDALDVTLDIERLGSITSIPLLEIRR